MAKLSRFTQLIFASTAGNQQIAEFGSLAAGTPLLYNGTTITPAIVQTLSNYLSGWLSAVVGANSPAYEDWNAICYLFAYQLAYLFQAGVPEWDAGTIYFKGSVVNDGGGNLYTSLTDSNTNNALTSVTNWSIAGNSISTKTANYTLVAADNFIRGNTTSSTFTLTLPAVASTPVGKKFLIKNVGAGNQLTVQANAAEVIDGANTYVLESSPTMETLSIENNGSSWDII